MLMISVVSVTPPSSVGHLGDHLGFGLHLSHLIEQLAPDGDQGVLPAVRRELVLGLPAEDEIVQPVGLKAVGHRHAELERAEVPELEERPQTTGDERLVDAREAEGGLVVPVEDAAEQLHVEGKRRHPRRLAARFDEPLLTEELDEHVGPVDEGQVMVVELVQEPEAIAHLSQLGLGVEGKGHEGQVGFGKAHAELPAPRLLLCLEDDLGPGIRIDLPEQGDLDLPREEVVLEPGEGAALRLLHVVLRQVADEVAGDPHVEEQLTRAPALVKRKRLARPREIDQRWHPARRRRTCGRARRRLAHRRPRWRCDGHRGRRRLDLLEPLAQVVDGLLVALLHALELLAHLLELLAHRFGVLSRGDRRRERRRGDDGENDPTTHGLLRGREWGVGPGAGGLAPGRTGGR